MVSTVKITRKRYPFTLAYYTEGAVTVADNGDKTVGPGEWSGGEACDAVPSGARQQEVAFEDGVVGNYTWHVILPKEGHRYSPGEKVRLTRYGLEKEYTVKGFMEYQFRRHVAL